jgi:hypothetical protein
MARMRTPPRKALVKLLLVYGVASLIHFIHNAEFLADYPGLPVTWTRAGVYFAWLGMTLTGILGWLLLTRGHQVAGLVLVAVYAALGIDSLGHYVVAPLSAHSMGMNATILMEVAAAALLFLEAMKLMARRALRRR